MTSEFRKRMLGQERAVGEFLRALGPSSVPGPRWTQYEWSHLGFQRWLVQHGKVNPAGGNRAGSDAIVATGECRRTTQDGV